VIEKFTVLPHGAINDCEGIKPSTFQTLLAGTVWVVDTNKT
jgi:hypothetical protein